MSALDPRRIPVSRALWTVAGLALLIEAAVGAKYASTLHGHTEQSRRRAEVVRAVRAEVLALTDISATTSDKQINQLLDGMTPHLKKEFSPQVDAFRQAMVQNNVHSKGKVVSVGLATTEPGRATAVVAAAAQVSNNRTQGDQDRSYRLRLTLKKVGRTWLVDSMEFVS